MHCPSTVLYPTPDDPQAFKVYRGGAPAVGTPARPPVRRSETPFPSGGAGQARSVSFGLLKDASATGTRAGSETAKRSPPTAELLAEGASLCRFSVAGDC